jgi:hypothetical protein
MASGPAGNRTADRHVQGFPAARARRGIEDAGRRVIRRSSAVEGGHAAVAPLPAVGRSVPAPGGNRDVPTGELPFAPEPVVRASTAPAPAPASADG